ncbi:PhoX family protein [Pseudorhodoferax sp.]|uniref:PhoX family protein n=1 Tax=Pseudorhodoferax sp. TaxID=1993553 RepID=UPI002DD6A3FD|nr:PhoX family phosphatase [Pseudorhodoferax sp.]
MSRIYDPLKGISNPSARPSMLALCDASRRTVLRSGFGAAAAALFAPWVAGCATPATAARLGFKGVPASRADAVTVPEGYVAEVITRWGDPVGIAGAMPAWREDAGNTAAEQALQFGMHHDGMQFYPLAGSSTHGLLAMNHEYTDDGLLHPDGLTPWTADKVKKAQTAVGLSVCEVRFEQGRWQVQRPSRHARRTTMATPFAVGGPAAGHRLMQTAADPAGRTVLGTLANCASGRTPWGTYLSGEENFQFLFSGGDSPTPDQRRWGLVRSGWYRWGDHDERFDTRRNPNEFNRFGWVVELDPEDPTSTPVKRTALGRAVHEGAWVAVTRDGRAVVYSGEDARFEYIYKFVSRDRIAPGGAKANAELLDHGTLYVARFDADGSGRWLPMAQGQGPLTAANGFADQGEVVIRSRQAADLLGATPMDRAEWLAVSQSTGEVYCTLTNNERRGRPGQRGVDAANPRANNTFGHIIRWQEDGDFDGQTMRWNHLVLAGDPAQERPEARGTIRGDLFACPDGLAFDPAGRLWICTDMGPRAMNQGEMARIGNNQMLACDVATGEVRRFLTGPVNCEVTGPAFTPDGRTLFVNIQHPGETPGERNDPADPRKVSNWPDFSPGGRPRSATLAIRRLDGGVVGT